MPYSRIYENIYSFPVTTNGIVLTENVKIFFNPCPEIRNRHVKAISISFYNTYAGQTDQAYITLKNGKGEVLIYNYPAVDLQDSTTAATTANYVYRLRLTNFQDIDLANSYFFYNDLSGPLGANNQPIFNINFYLD